MCLLNVKVLGSYMSHSTTFLITWLLIKTALLVGNEYSPRCHWNKSYVREIDTGAIYLKLSLTKKQYCHDL